MTPSIRLTILVASAWLTALVLASAAHAAVTVAPVFGSHMVLQRDLPLTVWGTAGPSEQVTVSFDDSTASAMPDAKGQWHVTLIAPVCDGKVHVLTAKGSNTLIYDDILVGEVWLGSGQSNMARAGAKVGEAGRIPGIRLMRDDGWVPCTAESAEAFSTVLFFFGQRLHQELKIPIGLINESRGSKPIEAFLPPPKAGGLYTSLIMPLQPLSLRGVLWYQGEANRDDGLGYAPKLQSLIEGWRRAWGREFSFYLVQIAPFTGYTDKYDIPSLWEAQLSGLKLPRTGVAVINDTAGTMTNIHPGGKDKVGSRLAGWALAKDYGRTDLEYSGPLYASMAIEGPRIRIAFSHAKGLRTSDGGPLGECEIAGADGVYVHASAAIEGDTVVVEAAQVGAPVKARYAWRNTPIVTLVNGAGLPCSAFHTDDWHGGTAE
jgi:sialate O-acetylesterase